MQNQSQILDCGRMNTTNALIPTVLLALILGTQITLAQDSSAIRESNASGIIFVGKGLRSDAFAEGVEYQSVTKFENTLTIEPTKGDRKVIRIDDVKSVIEYPNLNKNYLVAEDFERLEKALQEMKSAAERFSRNGGLLNPMISAVSDFIDLRSKTGKVYFLGQWIESSDVEKMAREGNSSAIKNGIPEVLIDKYGNRFEGFSISSVGSDSIVVRHSKGVATIKLADIPKELQEKYGFKSSLDKPESNVKPESSPGMTDYSDVNNLTFRKPGEDPWVPKTLNDVTDCVVLIEGDKGSGTGFICDIEGESFIYTNAHVVSESQILKVIDRHGNLYKDVDRVELAAEGFANGDVLRFHLVNPRKKALKLAEASFSLNDGDAVAALGNSQGLAVVRILDGKIAGVGPERIEITAEIVQGNSGGPVVSISDFSVVGISTLAYKKATDIWSKDTEFDGVRRFALRPNLIKIWDEFEVRQFVTEGMVLTQMKDNVRLTALLGLLDFRFDGVVIDQTLPLEGEYIVKDMLDQYKDHMIVKGIFALDKKLRANQGDSYQSIVDFSTFVSETGRAMNNLRISQNFQKWSFYHQKILEETELLSQHQEKEKLMKLILDDLRSIR